MDPTVTLINNKSSTPSSLTNNNSISSLPRVSTNKSFERIKVGYEPFKLEGNDKVFSPIISNKDNSNTKKAQQKDNNNSDSLIEDDFSPNLDFLSQQSSNLPSSLFPTHTAGRKLSKISENTQLSTIQQSKLESKPLKPITTLSRSSSSDGSVSSKVSERDLSVSGEEKVGQEDSCLTKQTRRVYSHNRDPLSRILEEKDIKALVTEQPETIYNSEEGEQITSDISTISTNHFPNATPILSSNLNSSEHLSASTDVSSILNPTSLSISVHSEKSILGDMYSTIKQGQSSVAITSSPTPIPDKYPNISSLKNVKEGRAGLLHREDKYPGPGAYFSHKSGPMGDLSGGLSPNKRPRFYTQNSQSRNERWPSPSIDSTRERMSGRKVMEGWPSSPRRMQLASPRFKSLTDLMEGPEGSEQQQESSACRVNPLSSPSHNTFKPSNDSVHPTTPVNSILNLNPICEEDSEEEDKEEKKEEEEDGVEKRQESRELEQKVIKEQEEILDSKNDEKDRFPKPGKFFGSNRTKNSRFLDLMSNEESSPIPPSVLSPQSFGRRQPMSLGRLTFNNNPKKLLNRENNSGTSLPQGTQTISEEDNDGEEDDVIEEQQAKAKGREKRMSGSFSSSLDGINEDEELDGLEEQKEQKESLPLPDFSKNGSNRKTRTLDIDLFSSKEKYVEESKSERKSPGARITARLFPSIQSRRTMPQLTVRTPLPMLSISETEDDEEEEEETEMSSDNASSRYPPSELSDILPSPATSMTPSVSSTPMTPVSGKSTSWRWPKRSFSPAREKNKELPNDDPSDHIGKVGSNIWAKKTLGQLRKYHQRQSPSILSKGFNLPSPLKEPTTPLQSPVSDISDSKKSPAVSIPEQPLETINEEEEDEEIGIWSSEEVDLTDSGIDEKKPSTPTSISSILNSNIIEEEPQGMKVSPEHLTVVGGMFVSRDSPNASTTSLTLRSNPSSSSLAKHNAKPLFETTFTISNITDKPLRYEILWPAFRFDVTPAYGVVKPQSVTLVKISVMHKHLSAGSKRDDSKKLMGILKGSEKDDDNRPLMGRTRLLVLCENNERKEVIVDIVQVKKKVKGEVEHVRSSSKNAKDEDGNFIRRFSKSSGKSFTRTVDDLIKAARARTRKQTKPEDRPRPAKNNSKGKSTAVGTANKVQSAPPLRRTSSKPPSRSSSPEGNIRNRVVRRKASSSSLRSRPNTPDRRNSTSPSPNTRSRTPDESKSIKQLPQRKNLLYVGAPGNISCSPTTIRETNHSVFRIQNPTNKPVTWHLTTATNPFLRRSESTSTSATTSATASASTSAQKINDEVFLIMKTSGFLRPGQTEKVVVSFRPVIVGTYHQSFMLEDSMNADGAGGLGGVSVRIQGEGKLDVSAPVRPDIKRNSGSRIKDFEVSETEVHIPATRVGKRRSVGIKIHNPSSQLIRIKCKVDLGNEASTALSIPLSSVQIKPRAFVLLPIRFQPKEEGEIRGMIKLQAVGRTEVNVDIVAEGVSDAPLEIS
ncbi:4105_t:CDS:2 [Funneliformis caledonium]|uniref:4105_t:CDS:1 n=1 Tax=Funneliformis caledonium TaxID=1117310 RepID=A0A9N8Z6F7_9GLOM|nr:4105_t:CDS:2 [Funneliformis caledonium]